MTLLNAAPAATPTTALPSSMARVALSIALPAAPAATPAAVLSAALSAAVDALALVPREPDSFRPLGDDVLLELTRLAADEVRLAQLHVSLLAGEIARRSAPELGSLGLAQRTGHRTPDELVRVTTGTRVADARTAVRVGSALSAPVGGSGDEASDSPSPVAVAVLEGRVSVAVADAITTGLGSPSPAVSDAVLHEAAARLLPRIDGLDADRAAREARAERDQLDVDGIAEREKTRREQRSFRIGRRADGMGYAHWVLDPETFAIVSEVYDRVTSPKRAVPSFDGDDSDDGTRADSHADDRRSGSTSADQRATDARATDQRSTEQRASDTFAELLRQGVAADTSQLLGDGPVGVRVIVAGRALDERGGRGYLEGQPDAVSIETVERHACSTGTVILTVDGDPENAGQPLNLGRERRLFSRSQRLALAARDGGCRRPGCERPPSWCEVGLPGFDGHRDSDLLVAGRCSHGSGVFAGVQGSSRRALPARSNVQGPREGVRPVGHDHLELGESGRQEICAAATRGAAGIG
ncbi:MAG: 13E12 repeat family protein [Chryseoglobus sp.]|nr:DUF222 domain-containing protein [Microcella sp.]MBX9470488.1 13E12 repeat family protein [Microcella sp.]